MRHAGFVRVNFVVGRLGGPRSPRYANVVDIFLFYPIGIDTVVLARTVLWRVSGDHLRGEGGDAYLVDSEDDDVVRRVDRLAVYRQTRPVGGDHSLAEVASVVSATPLHQLVEAGRVVLDRKNTLPDHSTIQTQANGPYSIHRQT